MPRVICKTLPGSLSASLRSPFAGCPSAEGGPPWPSVRLSERRQVENHRAWPDRRSWPRSGGRGRLRGALCAGAECCPRAGPHGHHTSRRLPPALFCLVAARSTAAQGKRVPRPGGSCHPRAGGLCYALSGSRRFASGFSVSICRPHLQVITALGMASILLPHFGHTNATRVASLCFIGLPPSTPHGAKFARSPVLAGRGVVLSGFRAAPRPGQTLALSALAPLLGLHPAHPRLFQRPRRRLPREKASQNRRPIGTSSPLRCPVASAPTSHPGGADCLLGTRSAHHAPACSRSNAARLGLTPCSRHSRMNAPAHRQCRALAHSWPSSAANTRAQAASAADPLSPSARVAAAFTASTLHTTCPGRTGSPLDSCSCTISRRHSMRIAAMCSTLSTPYRPPEMRTAPRLERLPPVLRLVVPLTKSCATMPSWPFVPKWHKWHSFPKPYTRRKFSSKDSDSCATCATIHHLPS